MIINSLIASCTGSRFLEPNDVDDATNFRHGHMILQHDKITNMMMPIIAPIKLHSVYVLLSKGQMLMKQMTFFLKSYYAVNDISW